MTHEIDVYGVFVSPVLAFGVAALPATFLLRRLLDRLGLYRLVWHRALFDAALYVVVLGGGEGRIVPFLVIALAVAAASVTGWQLWDYYMREPWTRDGRVRADVVQVAPDVSGIVASVSAGDNRTVRKGDLLFTVDRERYGIALQQADAAVENRRATTEQTARDAARYRELNTNAVSLAQREQAESTAGAADAAYRQALAELDAAKLGLARAEVRAPVNGIVTNFGLRPGNYVTTGKAVLALVDSDSFHVVGYLEETKLPRIREGDHATVHLMGVGEPLLGRVQGIARGIVDRERSESPDLLANVNPTFSWVRLAQRVPVRIELDGVPDPRDLVAGRTATVVVTGAARADGDHGASRSIPKGLARRVGGLEASAGSGGPSRGASTR